MGIVPVLKHPAGWVVLPVHYSMDPDRDLEWVAKAKARGDVEDWEKEQEINFSSISGVPCYEKFSLVAHTKDDLKYTPELPLCLACDFNVDPMGWIVFQVNNEIVYVFDEIYLSPGSVTEACQEFLNDYGDHYGDLYIYGDASGNARSQKDQRSNYDEIKLQFLGRPFRVKMRVPSKNASNEATVGAVNGRLRDAYDNPRLFIHRTKCPQLIADLSQVVWKDGSKPRQIMKVRQRRDPYFFRTHLSDALGAAMHRLYPTYQERRKEEEKAEKEKPAKKTLRKRRRHLVAEFPS